MELIKILIENLAINEGQAKGGLGVLLNYAMENLDADDFKKIISFIPGADNFMKEAPSDGGGLLGSIGGIASAFGGEKVGGLAELASGFSEIGLDTDMIQRFAGVVVDFLQDKGGDDLKDVIMKLL